MNCPLPKTSRGTGDLSLRMGSCWGVVDVLQGVSLKSCAVADAMFTLTVWHMMGTPPTDPGEIIAAISFIPAHAHSRHVSRGSHMQLVSDLLSADLLCGRTRTRVCACVSLSVCMYVCVCVCACAFHCD